MNILSILGKSNNYIGPSTANKIAQKINDDNKKSRALYDICELSLSEKFPSLESLEEARKVAEMMPIMPKGNIMKELAFSNISRKHLASGRGADAFEIAKVIPMVAIPPDMAVMVWWQWRWWT